MTDAFLAIPATRAGFDEFARLVVELGHGEPLPDPDTWTTHIAPDRVFLACEGACVGYVWVQVMDGVGYVRHVVVDPGRRGQGLGRRLMAIAAERLLANGCTRWELNVKPDNAPALALYRSLGMDFEYPTWVLRLPPEQAGGLPAEDPALRVDELPAERDAELAAAFRVPRGVFAFHRRKPRTRVFTVMRHARPCGLALFDPRIDGCFPFRAADPAVARAAIEALAPHLSSPAAELLLAIERDGAVAEALLALGATLRFRIEHLAGPLVAPASR